MKSSETAGKMAFWGYRKPNKHKEAKTEPTQPKLATRTKGQTRRRTTRATKRTGNKHRIRTQIAAANIPPKRAIEGNLVAAFPAYFCGKRGTGDPRKTVEGQNGSEKLGSWKGPKIHNSFLAYKTSGFVRLQKKKKPPNGTGSDPKSVQKHAHYLVADLRPREPKKAKYATF